MDRPDFVDGDAWCRYKFERESCIEKIDYFKLQLKRSKEEEKRTSRLLHINMCTLAICLAYLFLN